MKYINVITDNKSKYTDSFFTYRADDVQVGDLVRLPFGTHNKERTGVVCQIDVTPDFDESKIKDVSGVIEKNYLTEEIVKTALWMKPRYGIKYYDAFKCFMVKGKDAKEGKEKEPYKNVKGTYFKPESLTSEQQMAFDAISRALESETQENFLLHGVTSSGKTQVYMEAIEKTVSLGKTAIMLVPEISLTKQVIEVFAGRFGKSNIAVLHSKLTPRERYDEWKRIKKGDAKIVIGARLGVFAPLSNIGLIVMDEEHESSYKADMTPKYDTVDIALKRLGYYKGVLLLGSATPSVVSYSRVEQGIYKLLTLRERYNTTPLPEVEIVDMRAELKAGNTTIFSQRLFNQIKEELDEGRQIILLQNRRGYSGFVSCRQCGNVMRCPECGISLTYHKSIEKLMCHYCGRTFPVPKACPECDSTYIKHFGIGTEQVEEALKEFFPDTEVDRLDIDALKTRKDLDRILDAFSKGETKILVGTQLVAKGLDFKNVGLVGVIAADVTLNIPDYRSAERTFQLITQAAGRAGRGDRRGKVIIQTYEPDNYSLVAAASHDYEKFYKQEIKLRRFMDYPPFTDLIMVNFTAEEETLAIAAGERCKRYMENALAGDNNYKILAPQYSQNFKGKDAVRFYLLIKCPKGERNKYVYYLENFSKILINEKVECNMDLDINPYSTY
ncbi:MAG: primosomal protein N' [Firmicutes bacterium]|nr:primosomal protein N' [Bacillota bacterium]